MDITLNLDIWQVPSMIDPLLLNYCVFVLCTGAAAAMILWGWGKARRK